MVTATGRTGIEPNRSPATGRARLARLPDGNETANVVPMAADEDKADAESSASEQESSPGNDEAKSVEQDAESRADDQAPAEETAKDSASEIEPPEATGDAKASAPAAHPPGAAWANGFVRVERALTWFESRLLFVALMALVLSLVFWISLRGMASPVTSQSSAGIVFRMFVGAAVLGGIARLVAQWGLKLDETKSAFATVGGIIVGVASASAWRAVGIARFDAILNWLQEGSALTLVGGLRGLSSRLTIVVALVGAALAAARSKHINIDVVLRFMRPSWRVPVHVLGAVATAAVCFISSYGFLDYISIQGFSQRSEASMSEKVAGIRTISATHRFVFYKQLGLDLRTMPDVVFSGVRWDAPNRMNGRQWNTWLVESGFAEQFKAEELESMKAPPSMENEPRVPIVTLPGESAKGALEHDLNLIWSLGLFWIGVRVVLRALLVIAGHASVEPDADEPDEDDAPTAEAAR